MKKNLLSMVTVGALLLPLIASAAISDFLQNITSSILQPVLDFIIGLAALVFIFGIFRYITAGGDEEKIKEGRRFIVYGLIGLALMTMVWGLVNVISSSFNLNNTKPPVPQL